jgi:hypothetical protein
MRDELMDRLLPESAGPSAHVERAALRETQLLLGQRTSSAVIALVLATLVFACLPERATTFILLLRKAGVWLAAVLCALSLGFVWRFYCACVKLNALGLYRRARGIRASWSWENAGAFISLAVVTTLCAAAGWELISVGIGALPGLLVALWLGRRLKHIPDYETAREEELAKRSILQNDDDEPNGNA